MAPAENKFALQLEPTDKITFSGPELDKYPDTVTLKLKNTTSERLAYKVKCTSNAHFRIRPPVGLVEACATADVQLTFSLLENESVPENGRHYFAVYHIKAPTADEKPRDTWTNHKGKADGKKRLPVDFKNEAVAVEKKSVEDKQEEELKKDDATDKPAKKSSKKSDKDCDDKSADDKKDEDSDKESENDNGEDCGGDDSD